MSEQTPPLDYERVETERAPRRRITLVHVLVVIGTMALLLGILLPSMGRSRYTPSRELCFQRLRQIGQSIFLYANEHKGRSPATLADLLEQDMTTAVFVCPTSSDTSAAHGTTVQATAANVQAGGHLSYVVLFQELAKPPTAERVIGYEPLTNHSNAGMHVLYGDLHVDWVQADVAKKMLAELKAGHNPPRAEAGK